MIIEQNTISGNKTKEKSILALFLILALSIVVYYFAARYDVLERIVEFSHQHEEWELDELIVVSIFLVIAFAFFSLFMWTEANNQKAEALRHNNDLHKALSEIKQLRGIIPICSSCKQIRDDKGFWHQVELYVRDHSEAEFSHSICPECSKKLYPEFAERSTQHNSSS